MQPPPGGQYPQGPFPPPPQPYQAPGMQPPPQKRGMSCAVIAIIVAAISVPVIGVVAALAIYGVRRYLQASKSAEAKNTIGAITRAAVASYDTRAATGLTGADALCDSADPVPESVPSGRKYAPTSSDWDGTSDDAGWRCLRFSMTQPHYYQYNYNRGGDYLGSQDFGSEGFEAAALGDLDADGDESLYATGGRVRGGELKRDPQIEITNEFE